MPCDKSTSTPPRILVIDDDRDGCDLVGRRLRHAGYDVATAQTGSGALAEVATNRVDLILLDIGLPDQSGLELLRTLRRARTTLELPIIMATGCSQSGTVVEALRDGANDYVTKPLDIEVTLARIATQLEARRQVQEIRTADALGVGSELHGYRLSRKIGAGGFAVVFQAVQLSTGQEVAIKVLRPGLEADQYRRFELEIRLVAQLRHPHIVRLIDSGTVRSTPSYTHSGPPTTKPEPGVESGAGWHQPYMVMEYLEGEPLSGLLKRTGRLSVQGAVDLLLPVIGAMMVTHAMGIVHRDLKPANIFLSATAGGALHPVVLDFGIAKLVAAEPGMTRGGAFIGTPGYLAPEHIEGLAIDARADQYALGIILYECVTGRKAFDSSLSLSELAAALTSGDIVPVRECAPDVPPELAAVIERAISVSRASRYDNLEELGLELSRFASPHVSDQWRRSLPVRGPRPPAKNLSPESTAPTKLGIAIPAMPVVQPVTAPPGEGGPARSRVRPTNPTRRRAETPPTRRQCNPQAK